MKKLMMMVVSTLIMAGCSGSGVSIRRPADAAGRLAVVPFADCNTGSFTDCPESGKNVAEVYAVALGAPLITRDQAANFDMLLTGSVTEYNIAAPMAFRSNMVAVDLVLIDKRGNVVATQRSVEAEGNVFGSVESCTNKLAIAFKNELGR
jgi:hypothetical protein